MIQKLTLPGPRNEWHIGLRQQGSNWQWANGHPLTIAKWQRDRPNDDGTVGVISKDYPPGSKGLFDDVRINLHRAFICELTLVRSKSYMYSNHCKKRVDISLSSIKCFRAKKSALKMRLEKPDTKLHGLEFLK